MGRRAKSNLSTLGTKSLYNASYYIRRKLNRGLPLRKRSALPTNLDSLFPNRGQKILPKPVPGSCSLIQTPNGPIAVVMPKSSEQQQSGSSVSTFSPASSQNSSTLTVPCGNGTALLIPPGVSPSAIQALLNSLQSIPSSTNFPTIAPKTANPPPKEEIADPFEDLPTLSKADDEEEEQPESSQIPRLKDIKLEPKDEEEDAGPGFCTATVSVGADLTSAFLQPPSKESSSSYPGSEPLKDSPLRKGARASEDFEKAVVNVYLWMRKQRGVHLPVSERGHDLDLYDTAAAVGISRFTVTRILKRRKPERVEDEEKYQY